MGHAIALGSVSEGPYSPFQVANQTFNRAKLMNVGFVEAMKQYDWQCAIFHDVDLLPEDGEFLPGFISLFQ